MNRFGNKPFGAEYDPDKELAAQELNARAEKMIEAGAIKAAEHMACFSLADLRKLVEKQSETYRKLIEIRAYLGSPLYDKWRAAADEENFEQYVADEYDKISGGYYATARGAWGKFVLSPAQLEDQERDADWQRQTEELRHG